MRLEKPKALERIRCFKEPTGTLLWSYASELVYPGPLSWSTFAKCCVVLTQASAADPTSSLRSMVRIMEGGESKASA